MTDSLVSISEWQCNENGFQVSDPVRRAQIAVDVFKVLQSQGIDISQVDISEVTRLEAISKNQEVSYIVFRIRWTEIEARNDEQTNGEWKSRKKWSTEIRLGL